MLRTRFLTVALTVALVGVLLSGCATPRDDPAGSPLSDRNHDGVVVVAIIDVGINPYHFDFLSEYLPQHGNDDPTDDLPLTADPAEWVPGFPGASAFASYTRLDLNFTPDDGSRLAQELHDADQAAWDTLKPSEPDKVNYAYIPGTKVIGLVDFAGDGAFMPDSHGLGSATVSVGNLHGTCPECLLVFVHGLGNKASEWAAAQDWIDVQSNSWESSTLRGECTPSVPPLPVQCVTMRDSVNAGADLEARRVAVERGHQIFWAAGNGLQNDFRAPQSTYANDAKGNDWTIVVGAISGEGYSYSGTGKPVHVASLGTDYPRGAGPTVAGEGKFGGTSNATPVTAGMYAEALYQLRRLVGESRTQDAGVLARGTAGCGAANAQCALADGVLTIDEMREALFRAANYTLQGDQVGQVAALPLGASRTEVTYMSEGHGTYWGRYKGTDHWSHEADRIAGYAAGTWYSVQNGNQKAWFEVDSMCRQSAWGAWTQGYYNATTTLPAASQAWPVRSALVAACPDGGPAAAAVIAGITGLPV